MLPAKRPSEIVHNYRIDPISDEKELIYLYELEKYMFKNREDDTVSYSNIYKSYLDGVKLWNDLIVKVEEKFNSQRTGEVRYFVAKWTGNKNEFEYAERKLQTKNQDLFFSNLSVLISGREMNLKIMNELIDFILTNNAITYDFIKSGGIVTFAGGEVATPLDASALLHAKLPGFIDLPLEFIASPAILRNVNTEESPRDELLGNINDFIYNTAKCRRGEPETFKVHVNKLITLDKLFAGYFHFYVIGDVLFAEEPHKIYDTGKDDGRARFMLYDAELAQAFRDFFEKYKNLFTTKVSLKKLYESIEKDEIADETEMNDYFITLPLDEYRKVVSDERFWLSLELACGAAANMRV